MKRILLLLGITSLLALTACQSTRTYPPGNELIELIGHKDFQVVATNHPEFAKFLIWKISELELQQTQIKARMLEVIKMSPKPPVVPLTPTARHH